MIKKLVSDHVCLVVLLGSILVQLIGGAAIAQDQVTERKRYDCDYEGGTWDGYNCNFSSYGTSGPATSDPFAEAIGELIWKGLIEPALRENLENSFTPQAGTGGTQSTSPSSSFDNNSPTTTTIAPNQRHIIIASRNTAAEAISLAEYAALRFPQVEVFESSNGWFAVSIGTQEKRNAQLLLDELKRDAHIPEDSLLSDGTNYLRVVWPRNIDANSNANAFVDHPQGYPLYLRAEPSINGRVLAEIPSRTAPFPIFECGHFDGMREWCLVHYDGTEGWASERFLNIQWHNPE